MPDMSAKKFEVPKEYIDCLKWLGQIFAGVNLTSDKKTQIAEFLAECIGESGVKVNQSIFRNKGKLFDQGIDARVINLVLDLTFYTRHYDQYDKHVSSLKEQRLENLAENIHLFAYFKNYHGLHEPLNHLAKHDILCDQQNKLVLLQDKCRAANEFCSGADKFIESQADEQKNKAKTMAYHPSMFQHASPMNETAVFFQQISLYITNYSSQNSFHPKA